MLQFPWNLFLVSLIGTGFVVSEIAGTEMSMAFLFPKSQFAIRAITQPIINTIHAQNSVRAVTSTSLWSTNTAAADSTTDLDSGVVLSELRSRLIQSCRDGKNDATTIAALISDLERAGEEFGIGQASSVSGMLSGEWELLFSSTDATRSSPFFWAFRKAFPDTADRIYGITDAIPEPLKSIGPAIQRIDLVGDDGTNESGRFVSQVKISTLGGLASSIMTTRGTVVGFDGVDGIRIKIDTTKPEQSTAVTTLLGPFLGGVVNENLPPFPSGEALERVQPGSSEVILRTTYCDETLRISRNDEARFTEYFVWLRKEFASYEFL